MAEWDTAYINDLPDSAFAVIEPGGSKDGEGKTTPRSLRHLPHHDSSGSLDEPHLRNALSREPQTQLTPAEHSHAAAHLDAHARAAGIGEARAEEELEPEPADPESEARAVFFEAEVEVRSLDRREVDMRLLPWDHQVETMFGPEEFRRGAFGNPDPSSLYLYGMEHEVRFGAGQDGKPKPVRVPIGRGIRYSNEADGPHATFRVARTAAGDEGLALMADRIVQGVSVEFSQVPGGTQIVSQNGRRARIHHRALLMGATPTHRPAYGDQATVLAVRSQHEEGEVPENDTPVQEPAAAAAPPVVVQNIDPEALAAAIGTQFRSAMEAWEGRISGLEEEARKNIAIPARSATPDQRALRGDWMSVVLRQLAGERVAEAEMRSLDDLITTDNLGVVPPAYSTELIGVIDPSRPFLASTRKLDLPPAGLSLNVPKIVTRPETGVQSTEKSDIASNTTSITSVAYDAVTIAGGGDISLQLLKRSSPSYLSLYLELLAESLAKNAELLALNSLLDLWGDVGGVNDGGNLNPENLVLGAAWAAGATVRKKIDTMWLSSAAVGAFIDAKASTTNAPLYSQIQAGFTAGGQGGTISGLRPIWTPELDQTACDVLVGPSSGFGWTEDGSYTLQVDVPAKAGRDVALVTIMWFAPLYPTAFTAYGLSFS